MTLEELYRRIGGDYQSMIGRMRKEERAERFVLLFLKDTSFDELLKAMDASDTETAFRAAHTLKGVCLNLSFDELYQTAGALTEELRGKRMDRAKELLPDVAECYEKCIQEIGLYAAQRE